MFIVALSSVAKTRSKVNFHVIITLKHPSNVLSEKNKIKTIVKILYLYIMDTVVCRSVYIALKGLD